MLNKNRLTVIALLFIVLLSVRFLPGCGEGLNLLTNIPSDSDGTSGVDWTAWSYRRAVTISNSSTAQSDYQVNVVIENEPAFYTKAAANGDDIRFNYNGTSIPYWIEAWDSGGTRKFSVWVKVPVVSNPDSVIYLYYGNTGQSAASNFDNTFTKDSGFSGLAAGWHMDDGSGTAVDDSTSNANDGTITNASWSGTDGGKWYNVTTAGFSTGNSISFDGTGDYITVADDASLDVGNITIALWANVDRVDITQHFVSKWVISTPERSYALYLNGNTVQFDTSFNGSTSDTLNSSITLNSGTWYHIAATFDGSTKRIYINGDPQGSKAISGTINPSAADLTLGTINVSLGNYVDGVMDEIMIFDNDLSADEVKALSRRSKYSSTVSTPVVGSEELVP
jgi:hypothetical protein